LDIFQDSRSPRLPEQAIVSNVLGGVSEFARALQSLNCPMHRHLACSRDREALSVHGLHSLRLGRWQTVSKLLN
jgi:hypothetical protein